MSTENDYGIDVSTFLDGDLDPYFRPLSGPRVVAEAVVRRWTTPSGGLFFEPGFGVDVRELASQAMTPQALFTLGAQLAAQAEEDERVQSAHVDVSFNTQTRKLLVRADVHTAAGPFALVVSVDRLSVELLEPR
ncbi:MAG: hypothetical protein HYV09_03355 [Deltaproteobacteria bacterium]|nr:hypothetical protein [Deltaproteobacteria bacterium]